MNDQIKTVENLLKANEETKPRTPYLDVAKGALTTARANMQEHVAELGRKCDARRLQLAKDQEALQKLQGHVKADQAAVTPAQSQVAADEAAVTEASAAATEAAN